MSRPRSPGAARSRGKVARKGGSGQARTAERASPAPAARKPGGVWGAVRGKLLYPAALVVLSFASRLVGRGKDGLR